MYENGEAKTVGSISVKAPTSAAFCTDITTILGTVALGTAMGTASSHDRPQGIFSCTLKCHASNGENYSLTYKRDGMVISSYEADSILAAALTWADTIPAPGDDSSLSRGLGNRDEIEKKFKIGMQSFLSQ